MAFPSYCFCGNVVEHSLWGRITPQLIIPCVLLTLSLALWIGVAVALWKVSPATVRGPVCGISAQANKNRAKRPKKPYRYQIWIMDFKKPIMSYIRNIVANPRNAKNPTTSVTVVRITPPPRAGSAPNLRNIKGMIAPAMAATKRLIIMAAAMIRPRR